MALNVSVTNAVGFDAARELADAVLVVNGNDCAEPSASGSTYGSCGAPSGAVQDPQFGRLIGSNSLVWSDVALRFGNDSGLGAPLVGGGLSTLRIRGLRGNASQLRLASATDSAHPPLTALVRIQAEAGVSLRNGMLAVGQPTGGLVVGVRGQDAASACLGSDRGRAIVRLAEGFPQAFGDESPGSSDDGQTAIRVALDFDGIPDGVSVAIPEFVGCQQPEYGGKAAGDTDRLALGLVRGHDPRGLGGTVAGGSGSAATAAPVALASGRGTALYEVLRHDPQRLEDCHVAVQFEAESGGASNAYARISAGFAPRASVATAGSDEPIPRYARPLGLERPVVDLAACSTTLLFPFVSNQGGFDTGLVVTHGSWQAPTDSAASSAGACDLHYYGSDAETSIQGFVQHSTPLDTGEQLVFTLSGGNLAQNILATPQYQGYLVAVCGYPGARGYAFMSDGFGGVPDLGMGYVAPVVPLDSRGRRLVLPEGGR